ncbi:DUF559 domain-containing protein [Cellulomonas alba]|uniref:DUF559 domain-containing protein n=1 Tax=Cellulomonas alba TaxID=3053467 RepID=A0ABT7SHZ6_9CELL|nr:DUF559 domain-containing protein [Cellulomonas alba]MDM7855795.1 DUF559 domain-containing protein [Cellulomonas alba]
MQRDHLASRGPTRPELALYVLMDDVFGEGNWAPQHLIFDKWTVDACVPAMRLVVQADGDYWHGRNPEDRESPLVAKNMANDARQAAYLDRAGWRLLRLWEYELLHDPDRCRERIAATASEARAGR